MNPNRFQVNDPKAANIGDPFRGRYNYMLIRNLAVSGTVAGLGLVFSVFVSIACFGLFIVGTVDRFITAGLG